MKISKTLDRALAVSLGTVLGLPLLVATTAITAVADTVPQFKPQARRDADEVARIMRAFSRTFANSVATTIKYGYFNSFTHPGARIRAAGDAAELIAELQGLNQRDKASFVIRSINIAEDHIRSGKTNTDVLVESLQTLLSTYKVSTSLESLFKGTAHQA